MDLLQAETVEKEQNDDVPDILRMDRNESSDNPSMRNTGTNPDPGDE